MIAPPQTTTSPARTLRLPRPRREYSTPTARVPSNRIFVVNASVSTVRFGRLITGCRYARAAESQKLLNFGFQAYDTVQLYQSSRPVTALKVWKGADREVNAGFRPWGHPVNWRDPADGLNGGPRNFGGPPGSGGARFLMAGGSVRFVSAHTDPAVLRALATPSAGDEVPP